MKHKRRISKKLIAVIVVIAIIAGGGAVFLRTRSGSGEPVNVYPFHFIGMTEYWGDSQESYGPVSTDRMQAIYLSETQTVTEIKVEQGDTVKKGELLMTYDTTLSDITVEQQRLAVERLKLQQKNAQKRLQEIKNMVPMATPAPTVTPNPDEIDLGTELTEPYMISEDHFYDGSTPDGALICWLKDTTDIDDSILAALRGKSMEYQSINQTEPPTPSESPEPSVSPDPSETPIPSGTPDAAETPVPTGSPEAAVSPVPSEVPASPAPEETPEPSPTPTPPPSFYAVFKVTEGNLSLGTVTFWQGMHVTCTADDRYSFKFYDASAFPDHTLTPDEEEEEELPEPPSDSGYTAAQIAQMRAEQERTINDLSVQIKMAEAEYNIMKKEADNGRIYAEIDGEVVSLLSEEQARMEGQPLMKVSGGGGFYVEGSVSELELDNLLIGQEVTINDWNTGSTYTGQIESVGKFPDTNAGWSGMGNPNASFFPFRVYIDGSANLEPGRYVSVMYSTATSENGIYLENPFVRTEQGSSYVYVMGSGGRLEKRTVTTGKNLWGSYTEILSGLSEEDLIAFPYGKNVKDGAKAVESDISTLYE